MTRPSAVAVRAGARVREHREAQGLTVRDLAEKSGLKHGSRIHKLEHGSGATLDNLAAVARALGIPLKELVP